MSIFDSGTLRIDAGAPHVLRYHLISRMLLFCFLAPLLFLGIAQLTIGLKTLHKPPAAATKPEPKKADPQLNPIDKFLGAPAPEKKDKKDKDKAKDGKKDKTPTPTPAYVLAAIFATLYLVGRILEDRLVRRLFRKRLLGS